ncbi:MAG: RluA family pseudouridine synthase [Oscillospiraceae bacterium]|nr:RluA family pseudouridine synthase [Oscillospiraceae bacterium]
MKEFIIQKNDAGQRLDKFISKAVPNLPQSLMYKYIRLKRIKLNGKRCEISTRLSVGDILQMYINDEFFGEVSAEKEFLTVPCDIDIVYEDENILLVNKKCGMVVHEDDEKTADTLINRITHYLFKKGEYDPEREASFAPALCNRLDRNTSGIVICAKNAESLRLLNRIVKEREIIKNYLCITLGTPAPKEATLTAYLEKNEATNTVTVTDKKNQNNKTIVTKYTVLKSKNGLALCEIDLITGRTHQIRAHMAHIGHPLLGDGKYGINSENRARGIKTQALCAYKLTFSFKTDAGILNYLNGKSFEIKDIWFVNEYFK